jgi:hypothetical protein
MKAIHDTPLKNIRRAEHISHNLVGLDSGPKVTSATEANSITVVNAYVPQCRVYVAVRERVTRESLTDSAAE